MACPKHRSVCPQVAPSRHVDLATFGDDPALVKSTGHAVPARPLIPGDVNAAGHEQRCRTSPGIPEPRGGRAIQRALKEHQYKPRHPRIAVKPAGRGEVRDQKKLPETIVFRTKTRESDLAKWFLGKNLLSSSCFRSPANRRQPSTNPRSLSYLKTHASC